VLDSILFLNSFIEHIIAPLKFSEHFLSRLIFHLSCICFSLKSSSLLCLRHSFSLGNLSYTSSLQCQRVNSTYRNSLSLSDWEVNIVQT